MVIDDFRGRIAPNLCLDSGLLRDEVRDVLRQPDVDLFVRLAPVTVFLGVPAVRNDDDWKRILIVHPRPVHEDVFAVFEADRLLVPVELALLEENASEVFAARPELVLLVEVAATRPFVSVVLDVGVVENIHVIVSHVSARKAPHEIETVIILTEGHLLLFHLLWRVENVSGVELVLPHHDDTADAHDKVDEEDKVNDERDESAENVAAVIANFNFAIQIVLLVTIFFHSLMYAVLQGAKELLGALGEARHRRRFVFACFLLTKPSQRIFFPASLVLVIGFFLCLHAIELLLDLDGKFALEAFDCVAKGVLVRTGGRDVMVITGH